ncbi:GroES-like protein [Metschnikowia bicuspidata var. bicuspidata NRRL YB-4993]|uniref:GroES-like protein n=1 Tax=Metschnikowia bicuspidata var. bicuspidata NRRL YB-4993 TaxID=869754 RepID=A0A1A0H7S1_9ASCO|nr:GroES-like protein [Metschnikowia bicuspidata var. bicuspidata NRRL YB-4993]OBA20030.1 GroES-like protein [Metschnikowia bicuspidata var. bicuspidata NRRL YB-4993]
MTTNPSLVLNKVDDISFENYQIPRITEPNEVLVQVKKTGICGSDIHYYAHGKIGDFVLTKPMVLGHESSGIVVEVGDAVSHLKAGDKVAIEPGVPSRFSDEYKSGHYNLCPHMKFAATPNSKEGEPNPPGTLCKYYKSPADFLVKLPDHVSLELGAMVEPLTVGVHASRLGKITFGDHVVVFGAGPVGILAAAVARKFGAASVTVVDIFDNKLKLAKDMGAATHVFNSRTSDSLGDNLPAGVNPDVVLECTGAEVCIQQGVLALKAGGRFVQVGNAGSYVKFPITELVTKELILFGSFRYGYNDYKTSVDILDENYKNGKDNAMIDFEALITHRFSFDDAIKAYDKVRSGDGAAKCIIDGPE